MNPKLLESQFADLEEPQAGEDAIVVDVKRLPHEVVEEIKAKLGIKD